MSKVFAFNTGRLYTDAGQRIGCAMLPDGSIVFLDIDRQVDGFVPAGFYRHRTPLDRVRLAYLDEGWDYHVRPEGLAWSQYQEYLHTARTVALDAARVVKP